jgi:DNA-binding transcriptional LysR family regulator
VTAISDLEIFARVARTGNMSAAGREMGLSPAVVSKRISQLEERLGARLFQRTTRQLTLTETGTGYFKRVVDILSLCEEAEDFICRRNTKPRGHLKLAVPSAFSRLHVAPYLDAFLARYPEIELDVHVSDSFVDIIREGYDLAIRVGEMRDASLVSRRIAADTRVLCAAPAYLERRGAPESLADLAGHNCLAADTADMWRLEGPDGEVQVRPYGNVRASSGEFVRELVLSGVGIGLLSTWDVGTALRAGTLRRVLPSYGGSLTSGVYAVYPSREFMPAKVDVLIGYLADLYGPVPYWENDLNIGRVAAREALHVPCARIAKIAGVAAGR